MTVNKQVVDITSIATSTAQDYVDSTPANEDYIEAYVTSSDAGGNFYKSISFVSADANHTYGFSVPVDDYNLYNRYEPGRKVYILLNGRKFSKTNSSTVIGNDYNGAVGRISNIEYKNVIKRSCDAVNEEALVKHLTVSQAMNDAYLNQLIEFDDVQFATTSLGKTYFDASLNNLGGATNHNITDLYGNTLILRASEYATFASNTIPDGNGKIRGVLTKYGSDYQFMIRTINDVMLTGVRQTIDMSPPKGGSAITTPYPTTLNENFESYATSTSGFAFPNYINDAFVGARYWDVKTFGGNKYAQMTSFGSGETNKTYLIMPITFTPGYKFSFKSKDGYYNGNALKIYYSSNYIVGGNLANATLTDITASFAIASGTTTGYATNFTNSGIYTIPSTLSGAGYIIFEYSGAGSSTTTTYQIDDVVVTP